MLCSVFAPDTKADTCHGAVTAEKKISDTDKHKLCQRFAKVFRSVVTEVTDFFHKVIPMTFSTLLL